MTLININSYSYKNEYNQETESTDSAAFKARPLKHWRKVLCHNSNCKDLTQEIIKDKSSECGNCDPKKFIIRSGQTEKLINPVNNKEPNIKYCYSSLTYLKSKCKTYNQLLTGIANNPNVPSSRSTLECATGCNSNNSVNFTYKPNNKNYDTQGAVSCSSRLHRLKYNTITDNAASFKSAYGASAASAGKYRTYGGSPYFIKSKIDTICNRPLLKYRKHSTVCS